MSATPAPVKPDPKSKKADAEPPTTQPLQPEETAAEPLETQSLQSENVGAETPETQPLQPEETATEPSESQPLQSEETATEPSTTTSDAAPSESEQSSAEPPKTTVEKLLEERQKLDERIKEALKKEAEEKRKRETRKKILIGSAIQKQISKGKLTEDWLLEVLAAELTLDYDRKVFNLPPQTATVLPSADSQSIATEVSKAQETQPEELGMMALAAATALVPSEA